MITFAKELNHRANSKGYYTIFLRVIQDRKIKRYKSSVSLKNARDWNPRKQEVRMSNPDHKILNEKLNKELADLKATYEHLIEVGRLSTKLVVREMKAKSTEAEVPSFLNYVKKRVQEVFNAGQIRNYKKYQGFYNKLIAFQTKKGKVVDVTFDEINTAYVARFHVFLQSLPNGKDSTKKLHPNTIEVVLNIFKTIVKRSIEVDKIMSYNDNPFLTYKFHGIRTIKEKLNEAEINAIVSLPLEENTLIWHCRNYFMFSFYCAGIRAGDFIQLRWCNITSDNRINYSMGKNHKERDLILVPQAVEILKLYRKESCSPTDYIFPLLDTKQSWTKAVTQQEKDVLRNEDKVKMYRTISAKNALINKELKKIAHEAGISKKLSFHISRHSFAKIAKDKGVDNNQLKSLLAHSNLKITEAYMGNFETESNDRALMSIFDVKKDRKEGLLAQLRGLSPEELAELMNQL